MELQLKYNSQSGQPINAAMLRGNDPAGWLRQVSTWAIDHRELQCFIIPASIASTEAMGLLVIFKNSEATKKVDLLEPYTCVAGRLYIPCHATLFPVLLEKELSQLLLWDIQVFHPVAGLVGFDYSNRIPLQELVLFNEPKATDWSFANPGIAEKPGLLEIIVKPASGNEIIEELKENIGQKNIWDIPERDDEKRTALEKIGDSIKTGLFSSLYGMLGLFDKLIPVLAGNNTETGSSGPGWKQKLENWLVKNLEELQKKRNDEIQRLLNLFEEDTNEALQFALPLNSPYLDRGRSQQLSSRLSRNNPSFNMGRLGGSTNVDTWDVSPYYNDLRTKYLKAAQKEIERKDFKKAAYVYAHLLGDYYSAANVLEQGQLYREAAALHKDHLKNIPAAAKCLENGQLYLEAIELYKELKQDEKVGDLYISLHQQHNATTWFENSIATKLHNNDYLDAARIVDEKLSQEERAKQLLMEGWAGPQMPEPCLKKYFEIVCRDEKAPLDHIVRQVYEQHTAGHKKPSLLNVMEHLNKKHPGETLLNTTQDIAYEIIHEQADKGNIQSLHKLKSFLPGDKLISSDTSRYNSRSKRKQSTDLPTHITIDEKTRWINGAWCRGQLVVIGVKDGYPQLARVNSYGSVEYYPWSEPVEKYEYFHIITAPYHSNHVLLHTRTAFLDTSRRLPKNKYFSEQLYIGCHSWLHKSAPRLIITPDNHFHRLDISHGTLTLHKYSTGGILQASINCSFNGEKISLGNESPNATMAFSEDYYFTYSGMLVLVIAKDGNTRITDLRTGVRLIGASHNIGGGFYMVISTNKGCVLCKPKAGELNFAGTYFAEKLIPHSIEFITTHRFVIAEKNKATVFEIINDHPRVIEEISSTSPIIGIAPGFERDKFIVMDEGGKITTHSIG